MKYNHLFDVGFEVVSHNDWDSVTPDELLNALEDRLDYLRSLPKAEVLEAFGYSDTYEVD